MMENVYDLVADFYDNDEGWNTVLYRQYAEGFLRREAWSGHTDNQLQNEWQYMLMLCLYLSNADILMGDMSDDDIIDAVAWFGRNIADFRITAENVEDFLNVIGRLFVYLKEKKAITSAVAPTMAKNKLLPNGKELAIIGDYGEFVLGEEDRALYETADLPNKIYLNMGEMLSNNLNELRIFYQADLYNSDIDRAAVLYQSFFTEEELDIKGRTDEFWQAFWDYFIFDYHLISNDKTPLQNFIDCTKNKDADILKELLMARLAIFTINEERAEGLYECKDFLTGEEYILNLPLEGDDNFENMLFVGHIFYNKSMIMNYIRCLTLNKIERKNLREILGKVFKWYKIQEPKADMEEFIARHPMVLRKLAFSYAYYSKLNVFNRETKVRDYIPIKDSGKLDEVEKFLERVMKPMKFSKRDISLATRLWKDFSIRGNEKFIKPEVWASGVLGNYIALNGVVKIPEKDFVKVFKDVPLESMKIAIDTIKNTLKIEKSDPRYLNEEGFLNMVFLENN